MTTNKESKEIKKIEKIWVHNSVEKNLEILKKRLEEVKPWFDYEVNKDKTYNLKYSWEKLNIDVKNPLWLINLAKLVKSHIENKKLIKSIKKYTPIIKEFPWNTELYINDKLFWKDTKVTDSNELYETIKYNQNGKKKDELKKPNPIYANHIDNIWKTITKNYWDFLKKIIK